MKVLMLSWEYTPHIVGGLGARVVDLVSELVADGVEVHLVVPRLGGGEFTEPLPMPDGSPATNGSRVYRVEPSGMQGDFFTNTWHDNIQVRASALTWYGTKAALTSYTTMTGSADSPLSPSSIISTYLSSRLSMQRRWGITRASSRRDAALHTHGGVVAYLKFVAHYHVQPVYVLGGAGIFGAPAEKITVIPNGVDPRQFDALRGLDLASFRVAYARPDQPIVYYVGRMVPQKGLQTIVEAAPYVLREWPGVKFVLAGGGSGYTNELRAKAIELGVANNIIFPGRISDEVRDGLFKVADAAVFPSIYEPFGIVALEAMAAGTPVIVSDVGGLSEVVDLHETGIKVYPDDPQSLAWGILHTLKHPEWSRQRARNADRVVREQFNWSLIADKTLDVYKQVVAEAKAGDWAYKD